MILLQSIKLNPAPEDYTIDVKAIIWEEPYTQLCLNLNSINGICDMEIYIDILNIEDTICDIFLNIPGQYHIRPYPRGEENYDVFIDFKWNEIPIEQAWYKFPEYI